MPSVVNSKLTHTSHFTLLISQEKFGYIIVDIEIAWILFHFGPIQ